MTTSNDDSPQGRGIFSDEERDTIMRGVLEDTQQSVRREALVELFIDLRQHLGEQGEGWQRISLELHRLVEWLFRGSESYELALELYEQRFNLRGGNPAEILRLLLDEQLSPTRRAEAGWPQLVLKGPGLRYSPEQYRKRLEVATAAILGTDAQRIDCMHGCLKADDETLARVSGVLGET